MSFTKSILIGVVGLTLQASAAAQIYEREGSDGVPEFSDKPTAGAEVVDLPATNLAEPPPEGEKSPAPAPAQRAPRAVEPGASDPGQGEEEYGRIYYGDEEDELRARQQLKEKRIEGALHDKAKTHVEAGEGGAKADHAGGRPVHHGSRGHR